MGDRDIFYLWKDHNAAMVLGPKNILDRDWVDLLLILEGPRNAHNRAMELGRILDNKDDNVLMVLVHRALMVLVAVVCVDIYLEKALCFRNRDLLAPEIFDDAHERMVDRWNVFFPL